MTEFNTLFNEYQKNLELYVPVVARVHGPSHPVFYEVQKQYDNLIIAIENKKDLSDIFNNLSTITEGYVIPSDTCETYAAVYEMLENLNKAYHQ